MNFNEAKKSFEQLFNHEMNDTQMREFLISMKLDGQTPVDVIAAAASVMRSYAIALPVDPELQPKLIDVVGTGGDKSGSFNISTTTSILLASCGAYVAKHGNRSITSKSGSADVLEALGIRLDLSLEQTARMLEDTGFAFMFAQNHHPAMKFIMPVRKSISEKTVFNVLGPLTNPAGAQKFLLGVFDKAFVPKLAEALKLNHAKSAIVVSAAEGMDEISISGITYAASLKEDVIKEYEIDPVKLGIKRAPFEAILGGEAEQNAAILQNILKGNAEDAQRDIVLINAAAALEADGMARDLQEGLEIARDAIASGKAVQKLRQIIQVSSAL
ncbi:MAG: anthranilate phosphoribosyltransferase [Epsilonproteobacteria bacterium]|nr:MAG: anthranilate phosphoribosyltransferase [Campylobacterota bacterium]